MATLLDYAALSAIVYNDVRDVTTKLPQTPVNWTQLLYDSNPGFTAGAYQNGNDIVIAFKGTDSGLTVNAASDWLAANVPAGLGFGGSNF